MKEIETMQTIPGWAAIMLKSGIELDVMTSVKGFEQTEFDNCYDHSAIATINDIPIKFLSLNHLIRAKKEVCRDKDLLDIKELEKIRKASEE